jgi:hypothetical protein
MPAQTGLNYGSVGAAAASFVGIIQGPLAVIASLLSIIWLALQIYSWVDKWRAARVDRHAKK